MAGKAPAPKHLPKWIIPVGIGALVLLLLLRLRSGSSSRASQSFGGAVGLGGGATDNRTLSSAQDLLSQQVADALTLQKAQQTIVKNRFDFGKQLVANKQVGCPGGGTPRFDPETFTWGCQQEKHGGTLLERAQDLFNQITGDIRTVETGGGYAGYGSYGGVQTPRAGGGYTPGINGGGRLTA